VLSHDRGLSGPGDGREGGGGNKDDYEAQCTEDP
jgi:hypothetical protein